MCCLHLLNTIVCSMVPTLYRSSHWLIPDVIDIGDTRKKTGNSSMQYKWKRQEKEFCVFKINIQIWLQQDSCSKESDGPPWA
jgi:hypothetical protein